MILDRDIVSFFNLHAHCNQNHNCHQLIYVANHLITSSFSLSLPPPWGIPLAWSLSALPLLPLLVGLLVHLILAGEL